MNNNYIILGALAALGLYLYNKPETGPTTTKVIKVKKVKKENLDDQKVEDLNTNLGGQKKPANMVGGDSNTPPIIQETGL